MATISLARASLISRAPACHTLKKRHALQGSAPIKTLGAPFGRARAVMALPLPGDVLGLSLDTSMLAFVSAELPEGIKYTIQTSDFKLSQEAIKTFYMIFSCVFCWGAVVFGSMNDAYYESDEYRNAGGNGTQFWMYEKAEEDEEAAREELWRDELRQEIEEKMGEIKELQAGDEILEKEAV